MSIRIDLHVHSDVSEDAFDSVAKLAAAASKRGIEALGICDHNKLRRRARRIGGVVLLYGEEVSTAQGHVVVYGIERAFPAGIDVHELIERVREEGGVSIAAHPFAMGRHSLGELALTAGVDAIEKFNGSAVLGNVVGMMKVPVGVGGSDAHTAFEVGEAFTVMPCGAHEDEILACIRKKKFVAAWRPNPLSRIRRFAVRMGLRV
ncbi:MAG: PHP-associated domain-containing protein [Candidatus Micrarchaeia archaeon]